MAKRNLNILRILRSAETPSTLFASNDFATDIRKVLVPTSSVTRYSRVWRLSKPEEMPSGQILVGKLGFERAGHTDTVTYDENKLDFVSLTESLQMGTFVHYVLDYESQYLIAEVRPPEIRPQSVLGALREFLRTSPYNLGFEIEFVSDHQALTDWLASVTRVFNFKVSMRRPNPDYSGRAREIQDLLETSNASTVSVEAEAAMEESLEISESPLGPYAEYATEEHGQVQAQGSDGNVILSYDSAQNLLNRTIEVDDKETSDTLFRKLIGILHTVKQ